MSPRKTVAISALASLALIGIGRTSVALDFDPPALLLAPGGIVDIFRMRSVHGGFRDLASELTIDGVSFLFWFLAIWWSSKGFQILARSRMSKKEPIQLPEATRGK